MPGSRIYNLPKHLEQRTSRREKAYRDILALIVDGHLENGDRLPSEGEMAVRFGVSRPIIREALSELQHAGVIEVRRGAGSFVRSAKAINQGSSNYGAASTLGPVQSLTDVRQCFEFRASLEGEAAALAAEHRPLQPLQDIERALLRMERAISGPRASIEANTQFEADFEFHRAIARATENSYFERTLLSMRESIEFTIGLSRSLSLTFSRSRLYTVQDEHAYIFKMIQKGESDKAREAMRAHMMNACRRVFDGPSEMLRHD
ncbi:MAG TPA: FCD domain-containing protein [Pseudolabrys sp.]|nr:FCD domain-containing protein [Pseudolabrys sp.]